MTLKTHAKKVVRWKTWKNIEETTQRQDVDMTNDIATNDDVTHDIAVFSHMA